MTVKSHMLGESLLTVSYYISGVLLPGHFKFLIIFLSSQQSQFGHSSRLKDGKHRCNMAKLEGLPVEILQLISQLLPLRDRASFYRCSKLLQNATAWTLYHKSRKSAHFAMRGICEEEISLAILKQYRRNNTEAGLQEIYPMSDISPRRGEDFFGMSYTFLRYCKISLLASALLQDRLKIFEWLLQYGDEVNPFNNEPSAMSTNQAPLCWHPLFVALAENKQDAAMMLLNQGASPTVGVFGMTALHPAFASGYLPVITHLVTTYGLNINHADDRGDTPLIYALSSPHVSRDVLKSLIILGADVNKSTISHGQHLSPLSIAITNCRWDFALELLDCGADACGKMEVVLGQESSQPTRPLSRACLALRNYPQGTEGQRKLVIKKLLEQDADPNMLINEDNESQTLLVWLIRNKRDWEATCLINNPHLEVNNRYAQSKTALEWALCAEHGRPTIAKLLLEHGAEVPASTIHEFETLVTRIWEAMPRHIYNLLKRYPKLSASYQLLHRHFSRISPYDQDRNVKSFLRACPSPIAHLIRETGQAQLENRRLLELMRQRFEVHRKWPRRVACLRTDWWNANPIRRP